MIGLAKRIHQLYQNPVLHSQYAGRVELRPYQQPALKAIVESVRKRLGLSFVVIFSRQSGKNEDQLALYDYLLEIFQKVGGDIVHVEPTYKPQTVIAMRRLTARLKRNPLTRGRWKKEAGYIFSIGAASIHHFSGEPTANVVGGTASLLLSVNEAQDIEPDKYDKEFKPMAASTNATRVFWGTRWPNSLLERELEFALAAQAEDGIQRVFIVDADEVGKYVPAYKKFVAEEVKRLGRQHPLIKTQYFCESIEGAAGMFPAGRIALMHGEHAPQVIPTPGKIYAFILDVAGQDEAVFSGADQLENPGRDAVNLKIVEVDLSTLPDLKRPTYKVVYRQEWTGQKHTVIRRQLKAMGDLWRPIHWVIDATGVGEGLWAMLDEDFPTYTKPPELRRVIPFKFNSTTKSSLGYDFLGLIDGNRYKEYAPFDEHLLEQLQKCTYSVGVGPSKPMKWGVPDGTTNTHKDPVHDDDVITGALCTVLDGAKWAVPTPTVTIKPKDPLKRRTHA